MVTFIVGFVQNASIISALDQKTGIENGQSRIDLNQKKLVTAAIFLFAPQLAG